MNIKRIFIGLVVLVFALWVCISIMGKLFTTEVSKELEKYRSEIGKKIILEKDTLTIVNYSSIMETFTLPNGKEVNASMVFNKK